MSHVYSDNRTNKLIIRLTGSLDSKEAKNLYYDIQKKVTSLDNGFHVLADMSALEYVDKSTRHFIKETMDLLNRCGVSRIVKIIPKPELDIGFGIMEKFHHSENVVSHTYESYAEAQEHFEETNGKELANRLATFV